MMTTALEYRDVVRMLSVRGTPAFYDWSRKLYGSPKDKFPDGRSTVRDLGQLLYGILTSVDEWSLPLRAASPQYARTIDAHEAARMLGERLTRYFGEADVLVEADDGILADASAGSDYVKVRTGARFSPRDIDILEVHEGWVHVATSLNGQAQPVAKWLAKGPPRTTAVQEGLAALLEMFTFRTYPRRARRLNDRVLAVDKAEDGASFLDVFEWFRTEGYEEAECFNNTRRVFRGGVVEGGAPFTKDACYCKGIVLNYAFIRSAIQHDRVDLIPLLFVGKVAHEDVPVLARRISDGVVMPPRFLPPMFRDLNGLAIWMAYSTFFSQLGGEAIAEHYASLFARAGWGGPRTGVSPRFAVDQRPRKTGFAPWGGGGGGRGGGGGGVLGIGEETLLGVLRSEQLLLELALERQSLLERHFAAALYGALDEPHRHGRAARGAELVRVVEDLPHEPIVRFRRPHLVHEARLARLDDGKVQTLDHELHRACLADEAGQSLRPAGARKHAEGHLGQST